MASEVYDWCYPLLDEAAKKNIVIGCQTIAGQMEIGWPPNKQGAVVGHGGEAQLQRDLLSLGVATYDEYPDIYNYVAGRYLLNLPARAITGTRRGATTRNELQRGALRVRYVGAVDFLPHER